MNFLRGVCCCLVVMAQARCLEAPHAAEDLAREIRELTLDAEESYHVRDVELRRGDLKIFLNEGILSFAKPVAGRRVAAFFTTQGVETGDAEILVLPPTAAERASLTSFAGRPNLDEHFNSAVFFFADNTVNDVLQQVPQGRLRNTPGIVEGIAASANDLLQNFGRQFETRILESLLDGHNPVNGYFFAGIGSRELGPFDVLYAPDAVEPVSVGRVVEADNAEPMFQLWTGYRPRSAPLYSRPAPAISNYRIATTIGDDLSISATARFDFAAHADTGRAITLNLS
ncbi:MAG: hypothetical protein JOZ62_19650, partial [Acidobacteriaceae bacterium]|nr:hypothetical protein [Acidobacteriaceae bacterium]